MKVFIDNCISTRVKLAIDALSTDKHEVAHLQDIFPPDTIDEVWLKALGREKGWAVVSGDVRISKNPVNKQAWADAGVSIVFLAPNWSKMQRWEFAWRLIRHWPQIIEQLERSNKGSGYMLNENGKFTPVFAKQ